MPLTTQKAWRRNWSEYDSHDLVHTSQHNSPSANGPACDCKFQEALHKSTFQKVLRRVSVFNWHDTAYSGRTNLTLWKPSDWSIRLLKKRMHRGKLLLGRRRTRDWSLLQLSRTAWKSGRRSWPKPSSGIHIMLSWTEWQNCSMTMPCTTSGSSWKRGRGKQH